MRSLILLATLAVFSLTANAQSAPADASALPQKAISVAILGGASGIASNRPDPTAEKKLLASPKIQAELQRGLMEARAYATECFMIETFAPKDQKPSKHPSSVEKPYVPRTFALRSTCSPVGTFEPVPLSAPAISDKK